MPPNGYQMSPSPYPQGKPPRHINFLLLPMIITVLALFGALGFAFWAYAGMADYKDNSDQKVAAAVEKAVAEESTRKDKEFAEQSKSPFKEYTGSDTYGRVSFQYPRTWSAFINEQSTGGDPIDGYLHPNFVPGLQSKTAFALRVKVTNTTYANELQQLEGLAGTGKVKIVPFRAAKVPDVLGSRVDGEITPGQKDSLIIVPLRDKTLRIWTESADFLSDFDNSVLPSLSFIP